MSSPRSNTNTNTHNPAQRNVSGTSNTSAGSGSHGGLTPSGSRGNITSSASVGSNTGSSSPHGSRTNTPTRGSIPPSGSDRRSLPGPGPHGGLTPSGSRGNIATSVTSSPHGSATGASPQSQTFVPTGTWSDSAKQTLMNLTGGDASRTNWRWVAVEMEKRGHRFTEQAIRVQFNRMLSFDEAATKHREQAAADLTNSDTSQTRGTDGACDSPDHD